jgi:hypothetical protein
MHSYNETQRFDQWWLKVLMAIPLFEALAFMLSDYQSTGKVSNNAYVVLTLLSLISVFILWGISFTTQIDEMGIRFRFFPFHLKPKTIPWEDIESAAIREYSPLKEYGGWGVRYSFKNGKAYNIKGKTGLQLTLKNGKRILIGTSSVRKLENYLHDLKKQYSIAVIN